MRRNDPDQSSTEKRTQQQLEEFIHAKAEYNTAFSNLRKTLQAECETRKNIIGQTKNMGRLRKALSNVPMVATFVGATNDEDTKREIGAFEDDFINNVKAAMESSGTGKKDVVQKITAQLVAFKAAHDSLQNKAPLGIRAINATNANLTSCSSIFDDNTDLSAVEARATQLISLNKQRVERRSIVIPCPESYRGGEMKNQVPITRAYFGKLGPEYSVSELETLHKHASADPRLTSDSRVQVSRVIKATIELANRSRENNERTPGVGTQMKSNGARLSDAHNAIRSLWSEAREYKRNASNNHSDNNGDNHTTPGYNGN